MQQRAVDEAHLRERHAWIAGLLGPRRRRRTRVEILGGPAMLQALDHLLMFVPSVRAAAQWYASVLELPVSFVDDRFATIAVGSAQLCFHPADSKVPAGRAGQVAYWRVASLNDASEAFRRAGAVLYRGPLAIGADQGICQFADPFGNLFGLIGAYDEGRSFA
jgi:predicted enzyme related to lactoylglutathione lyase